MRGTFFILLFIVSLLAAVVGVGAPYWDYKEAAFVTQLLGYMEPSKEGADNSRVWLGPSVENTPTALVSGRLRVTEPPRAQEVRHWFTGKTYEGCSFAYQQMEVYEEGLFSSAWVPEGPLLEIEANGGYYIGDWAVDVTFFEGALVPKEKPQGLSTQDLKSSECPTGHDKCRIAESCVLLGDYTVLGSAPSGQDGSRRIELPNPSLLDYPLFQAKRQTPAEFAKNYSMLMAERIDIFPIHITLLILVCSLAMLVLSRREIDPRGRFPDPVWLIRFVLATNKSVWDHATVWLVLAIPFLPIASYYSINTPATFELILQCYILGYMLMLYGLCRRLKVVGEPAPEIRDDIAL